MQNGDRHFTKYVSNGCFYLSDYFFIYLASDTLFWSYYKEITRDSWVEKTRFALKKGDSLYCDFQPKLQAYKNSKKYHCTTKILLNSYHG